MSSAPAEATTILYADVPIARPRSTDYVTVAVRRWNFASRSRRVAVAWAGFRVYSTEQISKLMESKMRFGWKADVGSAAFRQQKRKRRHDGRRLYTRCERCRYATFFFLRRIAIAPARPAPNSDNVTGS